MVQGMLGERPLFILLLIEGGPQRIKPKKEIQMIIQKRTIYFVAAVFLASLIVVWVMSIDFLLSLNFGGLPTTRVDKLER